MSRWAASSTPQSIRLVFFFPLLTLCLLLFSGNAIAQATLKLLAPGGTTFTGPSEFDLKIESRDGMFGTAHEEVEFYWLKRNGERIDFEDAPANRIYREAELPPGVYKYTLEGRALSYNPSNGNERYRTVFSSTQVTVTLVQGTGGIQSSSSTCTIPWGQAVCAVTINWNSNAPAAQVWVSALDNSGMQLMAQGQSGSTLVPWINHNGHRFHLKNGSTTFATTEVRGTPTINHAPTVGIASPVDGALFASGASISISAAAGDSDDGIDRVEFRVDGASLATVTSPPYSTRVSTLSPGTHTVVAIATDSRGTSTSSSPVAFTVSSMPGISLTRRYVYDAQQRLCKTIEPETGSTVTAYDAAGNISWSAAGLDLPSATSCDHAAAESSGRVVRRTYDSRNRLATLRFPDRNGDVDFSYTPDGLLKQSTAYNDAGASTATTTYQYNKRRLLTGEALAQEGFTTRSLGYAYSANGHLAAHVYPSGHLMDYAPNALGQPTRAGNYATGVTYHPNGGIKQFTYGNGVIHTTIQNARRLPARSVDSNILALETTFDANGNAIAINDLQLGSSHDRQMQYDARDRLIAAGSPMFSGDGWHRFTYDALDNIRSWSLGGIKADQYWYDSNNRLSNIRNDNGATTVGLAYDVQGNLSNKNGQAYRFDYGNRLREATGKATYRYDAQGRRVQTIASGGSSDFSLYSKDGQLLYQFDQATGIQTETVYLAGSTVAQIEQVPGTVTIKYQHTDPLGSPVATTGQAGQLLELTHYEPYGKAINRQVNGIGYTGHKMDADTGLTYMQQRYYDPGTGTMLSADPITAYEQPLANFCRYCYARNNPYRFNDPDGRDAADRAYGAMVAYMLRNDPERLRIWAGGEAAATTEGSAAEHGATMGLAAGAFIDKGDYSGAAVAGAAGKAVIGAVLTGRGKNKIGPNIAAKGAHSSIKRDTNGNTTHTATYEQNPKNPSGFQEIKRVDLIGAAHRNPDGTKVPTPHVSEPGTKGVRPARPDEMPKDRK